MSTNKTENYQLHSWVPRDEFHVSEINENFALLDAALKAEAGSREGAVSALESALETSLANKPDIVIGTYVGLSATNRIELGRRPAIVHIERQDGTRSNSLTYAGMFSETLNTDGGGSITMTDTGFTLSSGTGLNGKNIVYLYVAYFA